MPPRPGWGAAGEPAAPLDRRQSRGPHAGQTERLVSLTHHGASHGQCTARTIVFIGARHAGHAGISRDGPDGGDSRTDVDSRSCTPTALNDNAFAGASPY